MRATIGMLRHVRRRNDIRFRGRMIANPETCAGKDCQGRGAQFISWSASTIRSLPENAGLFIADRLGSHAPLVGDLGGGFAHQGVLDQGCLAQG